MQASATPSKRLARQQLFAPASLQSSLARYLLSVNRRRLITDGRRRRPSLTRQLRWLSLTRRSTTHTVATPTSRLFPKHQRWWQSLTRQHASKGVLSLTRRHPPGARSYSLRRGRHPKLRLWSPSLTRQHTSKRAYLSIPQGSLALKQSLTRQLKCVVLHAWFSTQTMGTCGGNAA